MRHILKMTSIMLIILVLPAVHCHAKDKTVPKQKLYTAYNIWKWSGFNMRCINFKGGRSMLPAGTEILEPEITKYCTNPGGSDCTKIIQFKTASDKKNIKSSSPQTIIPEKPLKII